MPMPVVLAGPTENQRLTSSDPPQTTSKVTAGGLAPAHIFPQRPSSFRRTPPRTRYVAPVAMQAREIATPANGTRRAAATQVAAMIAAMSQLRTLAFPKEGTPSCEQAGGGASGGPTGPLRASESPVGAVGSNCGIDGWESESSVSAARTSCSGSDRLRWGPRDGTVTQRPHAGHFPAWPPILSFTRRVFPQFPH